MGASEKLEAAMHPLGKSGARAVLDAMAVNDAAIEHAQNLQNAVNEIRQLCHCAGPQGVIPLHRINALLTRHHV